MPAGSLVAFWGVALLLIAVPGADWAFTLGAGLRGRSLVPAVAGLVLGYAGMTVVVAAGVGALVAGSPAALTALTVAGGAYLVWHGTRTFTTPTSPPAGPVDTEPVDTQPVDAGAVDTRPVDAGSGDTRPMDARSVDVGSGDARLGGVGTGWATLAEGIGVSGLNPKGLLIFVALLPQFAGPDRAWPMAVQLGALGLVFMATCAVFYLALGSVARSVLRSRPAAARVVGRLAGAGMVVVGVSMVADRLT